MKIYGDKGSGNCLKVKFTADALGIGYDWIDIDIMKGESRTPEFLALSPQGQVPVVQLDGGRSLAQSNAIIRYLARGSNLLPDDPYRQAKVDEWLYWEQNAHEMFVAGARFQRVYLGRAQSEIPEATMTRGNAALDLMEAHLAGAPWFANESFSIADIALVAYTRLAGEGGFDLTARPKLRGWIARVEQKLGLAPA